AEPRSRAAAGAADHRAAAGGADGSAGGGRPVDRPRPDYAPRPGAPGAALRGATGQRLPYFPARDGPEHGPRLPVPVLG
nr:hypothetical protein [Tanacetum cinerariifolium]